MFVGFGVGGRLYHGHTIRMILLIPSWGRVNSICGTGEADGIDGE